MAALEVRAIMISMHNNNNAFNGKAHAIHISNHFSGALSPITTGVRSQSIHCIRAEQRSASTAEGQHMYSRVPVHASHLAPKQVSHMLCIIFTAAPRPSLLKGTLDRSEYLQYFSISFIIIWSFCFYISIFFINNYIIQLFTLE